LRLAQANSLQNTTFKIIKRKMDWRCGTSDRAPALQAQNPEFKIQSHQKEKKLARCQRLTLVILATQEAEIRRIVAQSQLRQNSL
jgi:hypothetical protein